MQNNGRHDSPRLRAFYRIRDAIFNSKLLPGDPLRELHLAKELQVSQATVREALIRLEHSGLVVRVANSGSRVTDLSKEDIRQRLEIRSELEQMAAAAALRRADDFFFAGLKDKVAAIAAAAARRDPFLLSESDFDFHRFIWGRCGNKVLMDTLEQVSAPLFAFVGLLRSRRGVRRSLASVVAAHRSMIDAFSAGSEDQVREEVHQHMYRFQGGFFGVAPSQPPPPEAA